MKGRGGEGRGGDGKRRERGEGRGQEEEVRSFFFLVLEGREEHKGEEWKGGEGNTKGE